MAFRKHAFRNRLLAFILLAAMLFVVALSFTACGEKDKNEVRVFCYGDYFAPSVVDLFEEETGITVVLDTYDTAEEMYPVIKNQAGVYDVICTSDYMIERMISEDLLQEIDFDNVPNYKYIGERYKKIADENYDPGNKYTVQYQWGIMGILYNKKDLGEGSITSWSDLWNEKYSGKIIMINSLRDTLGIGLLLNGKSINSTNEKDLEKAVEFLTEQKPLVYKYATDSVRDFLIGGTADLGVVWNGELLYSQELNSDLDFCIPEEGSELFFDCWVIPKNAYHKTNAEKWIDFMCRPDIAYINFQYLTYSTPNEGAVSLMDDETKNNPSLFPSDEVLEKCELLRDLGPDGDDLYSLYWKTFKSKQ